MTGDEDQLRWVLTLYVSGISTHSMRALATIRQICDEELAGRVELRVVDVHDDPQLVVAEGIVAVPTLVKRLPLPLRKLVGDLADRDRVQVALELDLPAPAPAPAPRDRTDEGPAP